MSTRRSILCLVLAGCGPVVAVDGETSSGPESPTTTVSTGVPPDPSTTSPGTTTSPTTSTTGVDVDTGLDSGEVGVDFIPVPDWHRGDECSMWEESCPPGMKCMPWANDGGGSWNATKCVDIVPDPRQVGESCTVEGNGVSGIDDCDLHSMCWDVDPETNMGECVAFCTGDEANPMCEQSNAHCNLSGDGVLILCLPFCHPLMPDCDEDEACVPVDGVFTCAPDASGDVGALGDPCEFINVCDPGLWCADASRVPECAGSTGCCAAFCDLDSAEPCEGWESGLECVAWYGPGQAPEGYETLGTCVLPE